MSRGPLLHVLLEDLLMDCRCDTLSEELDGALEPLARERAWVHLEGHARDSSQGLGVALYLINHFFGVADYQSAPRSNLCVEVLSCHRTPTSLLPHVGERARVPWEEIVSCLLRGLGDVA